jgi:hypothetical protein
MKENERRCGESVKKIPDSQYTRLKRKRKNKEKKPRNNSKKKNQIL